VSPTNGQALVFNTATNKWIPGSVTAGGGGGAAQNVTRTYTANGSTSAFTVTSGVTVDSVIVTENGVVQTPTSDYTISGSTLTFVGGAPANGVAIQIRELSGGGSANAQDFLSPFLLMGA
jgi:hypothetical protein